MSKLLITLFINLTYLMQVDLQLIANSRLHFSNYPHQKGVSELNPNDRLSTDSLSAEDIISALQQKIVFYDTAERKEITESLKIPNEKISFLSSLSDDEFDDLVRRENIYLYENIIESLQADKAIFRIKEQSENHVTISLQEKTNPDFSINFKLLHTSNGWIAE